MGKALNPQKNESPLIFIPKTDDELWDLTYRITGIRIPRVQICPNHQAPFEAFSNAYFARSATSVWKASRGFGGKSVLLAALGMVEACTLGASVNLLGGSGEQSGRVHDYMRGEESNLPDRFWKWDTAPTHLLVSDATKRETKLTNHGRIRVLTASQRSVHGPHPQRLRCDEVDEMDIKIWDAATGQTMPSRGIETQTVASSTHQYADGTMTEILTRADEMGWPVYEWCWKETVAGWLEQSTVDRKKTEVTKGMWDTEYDLQEPDPEGRAIMPEWVEFMFRKDLGIFEGKLGEEIEIEPPVEGGKYATGTDWAKSKDYTDIVTWRYDCHPKKMVAYLRIARQPWPKMIKKHNERVKRYGGKSHHDETGIGGVIADYIEVASKGVIMRGKPRNDLLTNYITGIESGDFVAPMIKTVYNEHKYAKNDDLYGSGHLPDSIAAGGLGALGTKKTGWARGMG